MRVVRVNIAECLEVGVIHSMLSERRLCTFPSGVRRLSETLGIAAIHTDESWTFCPGAAEHSRQERLYSVRQRRTAKLRQCADIVGAPDTVTIHPSSIE
ncbi:hypothetical protein LSAT2_007826 [Lamellibrachia satsuma]|nr:hypothetical protein LSAT2_007826 [Lamellibrachia satsuma]